jgi:hypothetical protein
MPQVAGLDRPWPLSAKAAVTADMLFCLFLTRSGHRVCIAAGANVQFPESTTHNPWKSAVRATDMPETLNGSAANVSRCHYLQILHKLSDLIPRRLSRFPRRANQLFNLSALLVVNFNQIKECRFHARAIRSWKTWPHTFDERSLTPMFQASSIKPFAALEPGVPTMQHIPHNSHESGSIVVFTATDMAPVIMYPCPKLFLFMDHV